MARKQWSTLDNEYELSLDNGTEVEVASNKYAAVSVTDWIAKNYFL